MASPPQALNELATRLRAEESVISPCVGDPNGQLPALGMLVAAGPRVSDAASEYAILFESIREGYLLHYARPRVVNGADDDLALLAGDYLYARGLERLAALGDLEAVRELSDLISLVAQLHAGDDDDPAEAQDGVPALWLASAVAVAAGPPPHHGEAKAALREGSAEAPRMLWDGAANTAAHAGLSERLGAAAESIGFRPPS